MFNQIAKKEQMCYYIYPKKALLSTLFYFLLSFHSFNHIDQEGILNTVTFRNNVPFL